MTDNICDNLRALESFHYDKNYTRDGVGLGKF